MKQPLVYFLKASLPLFYTWLCITSAAHAMSCSRRPPTGNDCPTGGCFYGNSSSGSQLPDTPPNTRTCYRTCYQDGFCMASITGIDAQDLQVVEQPATAGDSPLRRVYSPRFSTANYRKSTICKYSVKCNPGEIVSYSVEAFNLEGASNCYGNDTCVDWVEITYKNLGTKMKFCGSGELENPVHMDGENELTFEFFSNRRIEDSGFSYHVQCINASLGQNSGSTQTQDYEPCTQPGPRPIIVLLTPWVYNPFLVPRQFLVKMQWVLSYKNDIIQIRDESQHLYVLIRRIVYLDVANRFIARRCYRNLKGRNFNGYGFLVVYGYRAYYYQTGANPILQPSPKEADAILRLQRVMSKYVGYDFYDVEDDLDNEKIVSELESTQQLFRPSLISQYFAKRIANKLACHYGNACNAVLRAAACTYQALILQRDCKTGNSLR